ncbi:hypothetical protein DFH11DRAFT_1546390 [Phellopilus nigrolimitatus]|nr:hypothetical protein DFH11DRAFT_1546390 [Phellopilus nigrolimitatus]
MSAILNSEEATSAALHLLATKYYAIAAEGKSMVAYDIILTFPLEVEKIWKQKFSGLTILWFLNRWVYFFASIVTMIGEGALDYCNNYYQFPGLVATCQRLIVGIVELSVKLHSILSFGQPVLLPAGLTGCVLSVAADNATKFIGFWITELITDAVVLILTVYRSYTVYWRNRNFAHGQLWRVIFKDGVIYFFVMFSTNLVSVVMYLTLPSDLKSINASFGSLITCLLVARLILNLKVAGSRGQVTDTECTTYLEHQTHIEGLILEGSSTLGSDMHKDEVELLELRKLRQANA